MKKYLPIILCLFMIQFTRAQFTVGVQSLTWTDAARSNRSVPVVFHYPGTNSTFANDSFGFVVFGHGFDMTIDAYYNYADSLATHGYIVALTSNEGGLSPTHANLAQDLIFIYNMMKSESNNNSSSPLYHHVKSRGSIAGHSMGGGCTVLSCQYSDTATCYWTLAEATTNPSSITAAPMMKKPYLSFAGSTDCIAPATTNQIPTYDTCGSVCKTFIEIKNATHCQFAVSNVACNFGEGVSGCASTPLSRTAQTNAVLNFLYPYLDYYLNGNCSAWTLFESLYSADVTDVLMQTCNNVIPTNQAITGAPSVCSGSTDLLTATPAGFIYHWSNNATTSSISTSNPGSYSVTVSNGTCSVTAAPFTVTQASLPATPSAITAPDTVCSGIANINLSVINDPSASGYTWTLPSGWNISTGNNTHSISTISGNTGGVVSVTANNSCGTSSSVQKNIVVTLSGLATPGVVSGDTIPCVGQPVSYVIGAVTGANSYVWNYPGSWTLVSGGSTDTLHMIAGAGGGDITVQAVNGCGQGTPSSLSVMGLTAPVTSGIIGDTLVCSGQTSGYTISVTGGANSYLWSYPSGWTIVSGNNTDSLKLTGGSTSGNISVQAINACGRSAAANLNVIVKNTPTSGNITGNDSVCINGAAPLSFSLLNATGADSVLWSVPNSWNIVSGQGTNNIIINNNHQGGTINAQVNNSCGTASAIPVSLTEVDTPTAVISQSGDSLFANAGNSYQWFLNGSAISGATSQNYSTTQNGLYAVEITNNFGCTGTSAAFNYVYLSINEADLSNGFTVFPNPSGNGIFQLHISRNLTVYHLTVYDALGRGVYHREINSISNSLDLSFMSKGIYIARLEGDGYSIKKTLVIE